MIGIYKITSPSNKVYIGQSVDIKKRWMFYNYYLKKESCIGTKLYYSFQKYGPKNHQFEIIEECEENQLDEREIHWIKFFNSVEEGLNISEGGLGGKHNEETKQKMRKSALGRKLSKEAKEKISKANKIKKPKHSLESIESQKRKVSKPIGAFKNNILIKKYSSLKKAGEDLNIHSGNIIKYMKKNKEFHGFEWRYLNKVAIFHEAPLKIMPLIKDYTDGEYILPHLLDEYEDYLNYMMDSKKEGRYIIMDNSLNELKDKNNGKGYNEERLLHWIFKIEPNEFIIPDIWEDFKKSIISAKKWFEYKLPKLTKRVAVIQAKNYDEAKKCYKIYKDLGYKKIAFSYGASYYNDLVVNPNKDIGKALGRFNVICNMISEGIIKTKDEIHLLGCSIPNEFLYYNKIKQIKSIDTSNPVMSGYEGIKYESYGLLEKPKIKIDNIIDKPIKNLDIIINNIKCFKEINNLHM